MAGLVLGSGGVALVPIGWYFSHMLWIVAIALFFVGLVRTMGSEQWSGSPAPAPRRARLQALASLLPAVAALAVAGPAAAETHTRPLYDGAAHGSGHWRYERVSVDTDGRVAVYNTREPRISVHLPDRARANGAAVVMLPGGGLRVLGMGRELQREVDAFVANGIAVIVLEYRTLQIDPDTLARPPRPAPAGGAPIAFPRRAIRNGNANPSPDDPALNEVLRLATADGQAALRLAHEKAAEWHLDRARIGMIGTSAGGGVAFGALLSDGPPETKPDFVVSIFGPALQDVAASADAPPLFLVTEADHGPVTDGLLALLSIWKGAGRRAELHVYEVPNFSMTVDLWGARLFEWMREQAIIPR